MKKSKYAEIEFFRVLIEKLGGIAVLSEKLDIEYYEVNNWLHRGIIPVERVMKFSPILNISPLVLNNRHFHYITDWKALLKTVKFLNPTERHAIDNLPLKYK